MLSRKRAEEIDNYILENYYTLNHREMMKEMKLTNYMFYNRRNKLVADKKLVIEGLPIDWYGYIKQLTVIAKDYRTKHSGMWAKQLLKEMFEGDYEDIS